MKYSVTNDKRNNIECLLYLISCLIFCIIEIFVFSKISFANESIQTLWIIFQCAFSLSLVAIVALLKWIANKFLLKIAKIQNLSGKYKVIVESNYKGKQLLKRRFTLSKILIISISFLVQIKVSLEQ